jgi:hypothetical protein
MKRSAFDALEMFVSVLRDVPVPGFPDHSWSSDRDVVELRGKVADHARAVGALATDVRFTAAGRESERTRLDADLRAWVRDWEPPAVLAGQRDDLARALIERRRAAVPKVDAARLAEIRRGLEPFADDPVRMDAIYRTADPETRAAIDDAPPRWRPSVAGVPAAAPWVSDEVRVEVEAELDFDSATEIEREELDGLTALADGYARLRGQVLGALGKEG